MRCGLREALTLQQVSDSTKIELDLRYSSIFLEILRTQYKFVDAQMSWEKTVITHQFVHEQFDKRLEALFGVLASRYVHILPHRLSDHAWIKCIDGGKLIGVRIDL